MYTSLAFAGKPAPTTGIRGQARSHGTPMAIPRTRPLMSTRRPLRPGEGSPAASPAPLSEVATPEKRVLLIMIKSVDGMSVAKFRPPR